MSKPMKVAASFLGVVLACLAICWLAGFVEFTYQNVVPNEPLLHPLKVRQLDGTNMLLENGRALALSPLHSSDRSTDEIFLDISNQVRRSEFEVDIDEKDGERAEIYVRWPRKFRDSSPPFTIPIIRQTVGRKYRKPLAFGTYVSTNSQPNASLRP